MDIRKLQRAIVDGLEDVKAQNIAVFDTTHLSPLFERVIIASGTSNRQTKALASSVRETVKGRGLQVLRTEGEDNGEWIIVDCGAAVAHIMQPAIRDYYHLEEIWGGKAVRMKLGTAVTGLPKAAEPDEGGAAIAARPGAKKVAEKVAKKAVKAPVKASAKTPSKAAAPAKRAAARPAATPQAGSRTGARTGSQSMSKAPAGGGKAPAKPRAAPAKPGSARPAAAKRAGSAAPRRAAAKAASRPPAAKPARRG